MTTPTPDAPGLPACTCAENEGCTGPCDRADYSTVPLEERLRIESAILDDATGQNRRLKSLLTLAADAVAAARPLPSDWVAVPRELTTSMAEAAEQEFACGNDFSDAWEAAIATHIFDNGTGPAAAGGVTQSMLDAGTRAMMAFRKSGGDWTDKPAHAAEVVIRAALEQALTQQRGAVATVCHDTTLALVEPSANLEPGTKLYTTPQPSADAVREAAAAFLEAADARDNEETATQYPQHELRLRQYKAARDELESLLGRGG